jgi:GGDEF domain-containing protein/CHASE3 domain sensor protein
MKIFATRLFQLNNVTKSVSENILCAYYNVCLFLKTLAARFFRLNIAKKMLLGYLFCAFLTILIAFFILSRLERLNEINNSIMKRDIPLVEITDRMIDTVLAQELYARSSIILKSPDILPLFWARSEQLENLIKQMDALPQRKDLPIDRLSALHIEYNNCFMKGFEFLKNPSSAMAEKYDQQILEKQEALIQLLKKISSEARQEQNEKSRMSLSITRSAIRVTAGLCIGGILLGILVAMTITRNISGAIHQLKLSTKEISEGKFDYLPPIRNRDEIGDLSQAFQLMIKKLKRLEEMYLDASPLTHLPGGIAVENITKKRLADGAPFAFCLLDLANFKSFNDRYGYARGNEVIMATARIITAVIAKHGIQQDFIGHIGGDDFVIITLPEAYEKICTAIISAFDKMILDFYDPEDRERGYILGETRQGEKISFPIMTVSIAVVTNQQRKLKSHIQVGEIAAELKTYAKSFSRSTYVVDRRRNGLPGKE